MGAECGSQEFEMREKETSVRLWNNS